MKPIIFAAIFMIILLMAVLVAELLPRISASQSDCKVSQVPYKHADAIIGASATIMALAGIGSILSAKMSSKGAVAEKQKAGIALVAGCAIVVITAQALTIINTCCYALHTITYVSHTTITAVALVGMVLGYVAAIGTESGHARHEDGEESELDEEKRGFHV